MYQPVETKFLYSVADWTLRDGKRSLTLMITLRNQEGGEYIFNKWKNNDKDFAPYENVI